MSDYANEYPDHFAGTGEGLIVPCWLCGILAQFAHGPVHWEQFKERGPTCDTCWEEVYPKLQKECQDEKDQRALTPETEHLDDKTA